MLSVLQAVWFELTLFAAVGFLVFGLDDLVVDLLWLWFRPSDQLLTPRAQGVLDADAHPPRKLAIFVPAWHEESVISAMISHCRERWAGQAYWLFVGVYPNDPGTRAAIAGCGADHLSIVIVPHDGPTTKADCLNTLWHHFEMRRAEEPDGWAGIVLHDAEDLADPDELRVYHLGLLDHDLVQIPVLPVANPRSQWISGHYLDEFAESHGKDLIVRTRIGASLPLAGVGCALSLRVMNRLASLRHGRPFDDASLTEDYEMGLHIAELGLPGSFMRYRDAASGRLIAVRACFPATLDTAVRQKTRWIIGIALAGWDRVGWSLRLPELWMRWRDRRSILAALLTVAGYGAALLTVAIWIGGGGFTLSWSLAVLLTLNTLLLCWRLAMRMACVRQHHGWAESIRSVPRALVSSVIAIMASRRAVFQYARSLRTGALHWDKTEHHMPVVHDP